MNKAAILLLTSLLTSSALPAFAQSAQVYNSTCRQGGCWENLVLGQTQIDQNLLGGVTQTLYAVDIQTNNTHAATSRSTQWVQCSTSQPFVGFADSSSNSESVVLHYINPGGGSMNFSIEASHKLYWAVCHDQWDVNIWQPEEGLGAMARRLGYSIQLENEQKEVPVSLF